MLTGTGFTITCYTVDKTIQELVTAINQAVCKRVQKDALKITRSFFIKLNESR